MPQVMVVIEAQKDTVIVHVTGLCRRLVPVIISVEKVFASNNSTCDGRDCKQQCYETLLVAHPPSPVMN